MTLPVSYTSVSLMQLTLSAIGSISTVDSKILAHHAGQAEALINAKISKRYSIPLSNPVPLLETLATDLAIYRILSSRISLKSDAGDHPWYVRFKESINLLDAIVDGGLVLVDSSGAVLGGRDDSTVGRFYSTTMDYVPTFGEIPMEESVVDEDKVDDELDKRDSTLKDKLL